MENSWKVGRVKFFDHDRGFGFVECWDDGQDYFVHISKVESEHINDSNYVVFKLGPSRKKTGKFEARNVSLVSKFTKNHKYLKEQFAIYSNLYFRESIIDSLPSADTISLLENEISRFGIIETEEQFSEFIQSTKLFTSLDSDEILVNGIASTISDRIDQIAAPEYKIKFWFEGLFQNKPSHQILIDYFNSADSDEKLKIFKRIDNLTKIELIRESNALGEPNELLDLILEHIRQINGLGYYSNIKSQLFVPEFWENKLGYELFQNVIQELQLTIDDKQKLSLYLSGFLNEISPEIIINSCVELSMEEIERILESDVLNRTEAYKIIDKLLSRAIEGVSNFDIFLDNSDYDAESDYEYDYDYLQQKENERFEWLIGLSKKYLSENKSGKIENRITSELPIPMQVEFWENDCLNEIPHSTLSEYFTFFPVYPGNLQLKISNWISHGKITKTDAIELLKSNIQSLEEIRNRKQFYVLNHHLQTLSKLDVEISDLDDIVANSNSLFYKLSLWLEGLSSYFDFDEFKTKLVFLSPEDQIMFIKKLFWLAHSKKFDLTVDKLSQLTRIDFDIFSLNEEYNPDIILDISVDIVIEAIKSYSENEKFLLDGELLKIVIKDLVLDKKYKFKIEGLFEKCLGRYEAKFKWDTDGEVRKIRYGNNQFYFAISFSPGEHVHTWTRQGGYNRYVPNENFESLKEAVKELPGRKWNPNAEHWGVPSKYEEQVMQFARDNKLFINLEGSNYANNTHLATLSRKEVPNGITFCEGRLANKKHQMYNREFWWCTNQPCLSNCETIHNAESWKEYTLLDFLTILGFDLDDGNRVGDYIERGRYYQFISTINRFNRLLDKIYCEECQHILYPVEDSHFAHHRVVRFHCENEDCSEMHKEIYLHHCLNGKCNGIIDSRHSKRCPNGLYVCSNEKCGCCCSHDMMSRRLNNLKITGGYVHPNLINAVENKLGHLERAEHFCYQCGEQMEELSEDVYRCNDCSIQYNLTENKFKRPHKHLRQNKQSGAENPPPDNFDADDFLF